ncbi:MAG: hypothetical protein ACT4PM_07630 [Gemmatimonadales bacterium]
MGSATAQPTKPKLSSATPCCGITAIEARTGIVTAQEGSTGHVFQFEIKDRAVLRGLKVGQKVWADFAAGKVRLDPAEPVGVAILSRGVTPVDRVTSVDPAEPCCNISAINLTTRLITARITANGRTFQFEVPDQALLGTLKVGDKVWASGANRKARVNPAEPVGFAIVGPLPAGMP